MFDDCFPGSFVNTLGLDFPCRCSIKCYLPSLQAMCIFLSWSECTFPGAEPPAGPPKTRNIAGAFTFSKILSILEIEATLQHKNWTAKRNVLNFSYGPSNAPWSEIIYFWYATQNEFMDHEKSSKNVSKTDTQSYPLETPLEVKFSLPPYYS